MQGQSVVDSELATDYLKSCQGVMQGGGGRRVRVGAKFLLCSQGKRFQVRGGLGELI